MANRGDKPGMTTRPMALAQVAAQLQRAIEATHKDDFHGRVTLEVFVEAGKIRRANSSVSRSHQINEK